MTDTIIDPTLFTLYAGSDPTRWKQLKGSEVTHKRQGKGIITEVQPQDGSSQFLLKMSFDVNFGKPINKVYLSEFFFSDIFSGLTVSTNLEKTIFYSYETQTIDQLTVDFIAERIDYHLQLNNYEQVQALFASINTTALVQQFLSSDKWNSVIKTTQTTITNLLGQYEFDLAKNLYSSIQSHFPIEGFDRQVEIIRHRHTKEEKDRFLDNKILEITRYLECYAFDDADKIYKDIQKDYPQETYHQLKDSFLKQKQRVDLLSQLHTKFQAGKFNVADGIYTQSGLISLDEYIRLKSSWIQRYVLEHYGETINSEKADALAHPARNLLLSARAGSGKTMVMACKVGLLIDTEDAHPDQILAMAFNSDAAAEILKRTRNTFKQTAFENARTFHSLASQLVQPQEDILYDEKDSVITRKMSLFIQDLLKTEINNPAFMEKIYAFFRKEMREIERAGLLLDDEDYLDYRRNMRQISLKGEKVKSKGEKIIADYLFEHDIAYVYEKVWLKGCQIYRPDFSIYTQQKNYILEHWGIDEFDPLRSVPKDWTVTWDQYRAQMESKRKHWKEKKDDALLIETSIRDFREGREAFEKIIEVRLKSAGISHPLLSRQEIIQKLKDQDYNTITHLAELFLQFIQKAKKLMLSSIKVQKLRQTYKPKDEREAVFIDLACQIYKKYEKALEQNHKIDFDDLLIRAIQKIHTTKGECTIWLGTPQNRTLKMNDLRWILIDEYQDFSRLFFELIQAIRKYNPNLRMICVGDDWQAINGFAGSDLEYFHHFADWAEEASVASLKTNFRSQAEIVRAGNDLMLGKGDPAQWLPDKQDGELKILLMDDTWVEMREAQAYAEQKAKDERFMITEASEKENGKKTNRVVASKYLKCCYEIISSSEIMPKTVAILARTHWIDGMRLDEFESRLLACFTSADLEKFPDIAQKIMVQTAHKFKGLQADLVILLNVTDGSFPLLHPDNALFEIFGKTMADAFKEERRLFYVALTRAESRLYILTEKERESSFLKRLSAYRPQSWEEYRLSLSDNPNRRYETSSEEIRF